ncbi:type II secretory pathway, component PulD [Opitutaceae bacterium TAV1]|nr:type II secretory pathway, component PulD [Opitutaceae bacterium TAV1]
MRLSPLFPLCSKPLIVIALAGLFLPAIAQEAPPTPPPGDIRRLAVEAAPAAGNDNDAVGPIVLRDDSLLQVLDLLERWTGRTVLRPQNLPTATYSLTLPKPVTRAEAVLALETLLNLNGVSMSRLGDKFLKVTTIQLARTEAPEFIDGSALDQPASGKIGSKVFQLEFLRAGEFVPQIATLLSPTLGAAPVVFEKSNAFLITDSISTLQRIETLIGKLDKPVTSGLVTKTYTIEFAKASDLVTKIKAFLTPELLKTIGSATSYNADDRSNQVILISDPREQGFFDDLIARLDVRADPNTRSEVIALKHAISTDVAQILTQIVTGQANANRTTGQQQASTGRTGSGNRSTTTNTPAGQVTTRTATAPAATPSAIATSIAGAAAQQFSETTSVVADERSNSVIVSGTADDIRLARELIDKIDTLLAQVRIEVVIAEVLLDDQHNSGIESLGLRIENDKLTGIGGAIAGGTTIGGLDDTRFFQVAKENALAGVIGLSSSPRKSNNTILSVPTIVTSHNKKAEVFIGETRPVISGTTTSTENLNTSSTVTQQQIGITLTVTPLIGPNGSVQMEISQSVEDVSGSVTIDGNDQPIITRRNADSFLSAFSGDIIVLAGMQRTKKTESTSRLGPIPWIGDLLGKRSKLDQRTELVFFLRPTVLTNTPVDNVEAIRQIDSTPQAADIHKVIDTRPAAAPVYRGPNTITRASHPPSPSNPAPTPPAPPATPAAPAASTRSTNANDASRP